jgi:hypothetical protein
VPKVSAAADAGGSGEGANDVTKTEPVWRQRFDAFVARKAHAALSCELWPYKTDAAAPACQMVPVGNGWTSRLFDGPFYISRDDDPQRPSCSVVPVTQCR